MKKIKMFLVLMLGLAVITACEKKADSFDELSNPDLKKQYTRDSVKGNPFTMIHGTPDDDLIDSTWTPVAPGDGQEKIIGKDGNDTIYGYGDSDFIIGGDGDDNIYGGEGDDKINAGDGDDYR